MLDAVCTPRTTRSTRIALALMLVISLVLGGLAGCSSPKDDSAAPKSEGTAASWPMTVTDDSGREVEIKTQPQRIVSLAPANTEILYALGLGEKVVGVTTYCDYPAEAAEVEKIGDFAGPNIEAVTAVAPDLVFATSGVQADQVGALEALGATVLVIDPMTIDSVYKDMALIGQIAGVEDAATELVAEMKADIAAVQAAIGDEKPVTTFVEVGQDPLYTVGTGTLIDELVTLAGGTNVVGEEGYVAYSSEQVIAANPAVYLATKGSGSSPGSISARAGFDGMQSVKDGSIAILDDNLVSRPGPRIAQGLKLIAEALHPDKF